MKLPVLSAKEVLRTLERLGFEEVHRRGSHIKLKHADGRIIIIPYHTEVDRYTLRGALRDAGITEQDFLDNL